MNEDKPEQNVTKSIDLEFETFVSPAKIDLHSCSIVLPPNLVELLELYRDQNIKLSVTIKELKPRIIIENTIITLTTFKNMFKITVKPSIAAGDVAYRIWTQFPKGKYTVSLDDEYGYIYFEIRETCPIIDDQNNPKEIISRICSQANATMVDCKCWTRVEKWVLKEWYDTIENQVTSAATILE